MNDSKYEEENGQANAESEQQEQYNEKYKKQRRALIIYKFIRGT